MNGHSRSNQLVSNTQRTGNPNSKNVCSSARTGSCLIVGLRACAGRATCLMQNLTCIVIATATVFLLCVSSVLAQQSFSVPNFPVWHTFPGEYEQRRSPQSRLAETAPYATIDLEEFESMLNPPAETSQKTMTNGHGTASPDDDEDDYFVRHVANWSVRVDALFLRRSQAESVPLITNVATGAVVLNSRDLKFRHKTIPRISLVRHLGDGTSRVEVTYFGIDNWDSTRIRTGNLNFLGPGFALAINPAVFRMDYNSSMHSVEVQWQRDVSDLIRLRSGFRWLRFEDNLSAQEFNTPFIKVLDVETENNLFGPQLGGDFRLLDLDGYFQVFGRVNFGVFRNTAKQDIRTSFLGPPVNDRDHGISFLGEIGISADYPINHHVALRVGYQFGFLTGMALAPEQIFGSDLRWARWALGSSLMMTPGLSNPSGSTNLLSAFMIS